MIKSEIRRSFQSAAQIIEQLLGPERLFVDPVTVETYAADETPQHCVPAGVVFPYSHEDVMNLVRVANEYKLPLVARGAGSGNVGGALPVPGALVVSFECMNRILEFDADNRVMVVQSGAITGEIDARARSRGLFYPPDPGSAAFCRIGGNIAMNAAGPHSLKYGVTRDYVLGLRAVAGDGKSLRTGCRTSKGVVGYDLTRLLVGSEGTLALVTEATLRLLPAPTTSATLQACYRNSADACAAVSRVMTQPVIPSVLEFLDGAALNAIREAGAVEDLSAEAGAMLIAEADGEPAEVARQLRALAAALRGPGLLQLKQADTPEAIAALWTARRSLSHAVKRLAPLKINEDVVVPVSRLAALVARVEALAKTYRLIIVAFGHAGNGNLHVNLMVHPDDLREMMRAQLCLRELFATVLALGGTLSGEHGIGSEKRQFVPLEIPGETLALMRAIKQQFDPNGILNPGKLFPDPL